MLMSRRQHSNTRIGWMDQGQAKTSPTKPATKPTSATLEGRGRSRDDAARRSTGIDCGAVSTEALPVKSTPCWFACWMRPSLPLLRPCVLLGPRGACWLTASAHRFPFHGQHPLLINSTDSYRKKKRKSNFPHPSLGATLNVPCPSPQLVMHVENLATNTQQLIPPQLPLHKCICSAITTAGQHNGPAATSPKPLHSSSLGACRRFRPPSRAAVAQVPSTCTDSAPVPTQQ